jgi:carboxypeptidase C (cathepsin A)
MTETENQKKNDADKKQDIEKETPTPQDQLVETKHSITLDGKLIPYTVTCGTIVLKEESEKKGEKEGEAEGEKPKATVFFIAYTRDDVKDKSARPLTFSFNGGPGSSSVWLHLGVLGPRRVEMGDAGSLLPPPYHLVENEYTLLDETDLVFIDPVSTGYSRAVVGEKAKEFHGLTKDIQSVGDFIRLYTTRYQRWTSPKFLIGESYGTTRAAGLSGYLQERHGMYLNGVMLISAILNFQGYEFEPGNDLPYITHLPTYAATAWYHKQLEDDLQQKPLGSFLEEVEEFALGEYTLALMKGAALLPEERAFIVEKLARYTGLSVDFIERCDLRVEIFRFTKELLRSRRRTVGRIDTRFTGIDRDSAGENFEHDPSMSAIMGPYTATFYDYVRGELAFESDLPYEILHSDMWQHWSYAEHANKFVDVGDTLRKAMVINPFLKVFVAYGYYDLATPYKASEYTFNHLGLDPSLQGNLSMSYYEAGHMMYVHIPSLAKLKADLAAFLHETLSK